jgi:hypothetical protein
MDGDAQVLGHGLAKECGELVRVGIGGINPTSGKEGVVADLRGQREVSLQEVDVQCAFFVPVRHAGAFVFGKPQHEGSNGVVWL